MCLSFEIFRTRHAVDKGHAHVQFRDLHLQSQTGEPFEVRNHLLLRHAVQRKVALKPDTTDGNPVVQHAPHHVVHRVGLRVPRLGVVVVIKEDRLRVGFVRAAE